jgi:hypothetical protein
MEKTLEVINHLVDDGAIGALFYAEPVSTFAI